VDEGIIRVFRGKRIEGLHTQIIGRKIHRYDTVNSTNDMAFIHALKGAKEGAVFWARAQTKGRGRQGRRWISHKDKGVYFSIILRPDILVTEAPRITLLIAAAICKALRDFSGRQFLIKWPNDIVINDKKIGGILTEMDGEADRVKFLIVGVGIDTNFTRNELPIKEAVSLKMLMHREVANADVLTVCVKEIDACYAQFKKKGFSLLLKEARQLCGMWGKQIRTDSGIQGIAVDFDTQGALVVRQASGFLKHLHAGEVTLF
jgi:BirA family transcriptional regulator, biotin operon repressor / biotin---[acetyl-CoA-carboxylase] ligase